MSQVNGTYKRSTELINGFLYYLKKDREGRTADYVIYYRENYWFIGVWHGEGYVQAAIQYIYRIFQNNGEY